MHIAYPVQLDVLNIEISITHRYNSIGLLQLEMVCHSLIGKRTINPDAKHSSI